MSEKKANINRKLVMILSLLVLLLSSGIKTALVYAQADEVTLKPTDDTYADSLIPNSIHGNQSDLEVLNWQNLDLATYEKIVWLEFNLSSVLDGAVVDIATLHLYARSVGEIYNVSACSSPDASWTELTLTYSNMPSFNTTSMDSALIPTESQWYNWSVADAVRNALNGKPKVATIVLREISGHNSASGVSFDSKESPVYLGSYYSPTLVVHWSGIVPEFPLLPTLPLLMFAALIAVIVYRRKNSAQTF